MFGNIAASHPTTTPHRSKIKSSGVPAATAGSNRTKNRADLFGLTASTGVLGLNQSVLGGDSERWTDSVQWRDKYTAHLNEGWNYVPDEDAPDPELAVWHMRAEAAFRIATVPGGD